MPERVEAIVAEMTLEEKAAMTTGAGMWHTAAVERLGVGRVKMTDGPNGARGLTSDTGASLTPSVCIPSGSALGATWDPEIVGLASGTVARQAKQKSANVLLAPTVNLHRHPLWGRNFEAFSEDPFLTGKLAVGYVRGVQENGVIATVKHFVCNEVEHERRTSSSEVDERTLRELYLLPFEFAVREGGAGAVMSSYNRLNGRHVADDRRLLDEILRGEWGFGGFVMSDWWALVSTLEAAEAGLDVEMPGPGKGFGPALAEAVREGLASESLLDQKVRRMLTTFDHFGLLRDGYEDVEVPVDAGEDRAVARRAATEAIVCLRNEGHTLPLDRGRLRSVALLGRGAEKLAIMGGGSAQVVPHYELRLADVLGARLAGGARLSVDRGDDIARAASLARDADAAVVVVGTDEKEESEGFDRTTMALPCKQAKLVEAVMAANQRTVVVVNTGAAVELPFARAVPALLQCWFGGQELANALADVLLGEAEPGGRLPFSIPERIEHTPAFGGFPGESSSVRYGEGQLVGYRWYEARHLPVLFPFGHGLSYSSFSIGPVRVSARELAPGGKLTVEVEVENTGPRPGSEVVQVYVAPPGGGQLQPGGRMRPLKALKGFAKVRLGPGESTVAGIELTERSFAYYDIADADWFGLQERLGDAGSTSHQALHRERAGWYLDAGTYEIQVGRSSADICERVQVEVTGSSQPLPLSTPPG